MATVSGIATVGLKVFFFLLSLLDRADTKQASVVLEMIELDPYDVCLGDGMRLPVSIC